MDRGQPVLAPIAEALASLAPRGAFEVVPVPSGYPAPKVIQLGVLRRDDATLLFETSAGIPECVEATTSALLARGVSRLDAVLVTHAHGDHSGAAEVLSRFGREPGDRCPIYLHSAGHRLVTTPATEFFDESHDIVLVRAHRGTLDYSATLAGDTYERHLRAPYGGHYGVVPRRALRFVDRGRLPRGLIALHTPGHAADCVMYVDPALGVAIPGDTVLTSGVPDDPRTHRIVVPPLAVLDQKYSRAVESFLWTLGAMRRFFEAGTVRVIVPPHGRLAVIDPLGWVESVVDYFDTIHRRLVADVLGEPGRDVGFTANEIASRIEDPRAEPFATASHVYGLLCLYVEEGYLAVEERPRSRALVFRRRTLPPADYVRRFVDEGAGPLAVVHGQDVLVG